jgi:hypothetical protein
MFNEAVSLNKMQARGLRIGLVERPVSSQFRFHDRQFGRPELSLLKRPLSSLILLTQCPFPSAQAFSPVQTAPRALASILSIWMEVQCDLYGREEYHPEARIPPGPVQQKGRNPGGLPTTAPPGSAAGQGGGGLPVFLSGIGLDFDGAAEFIGVLERCNSSESKTRNAD